MKRVIRSGLLLLLCVICCAALTTQVQAATDTQSGTYQNISWTIEGDTITFSGTGSIPRNPGANGWGGDYRHVVIEEGITGIEFYAFRDSSDVETLTLPTSITEIQSDAFLIWMIENSGDYLCVKEVYFAGSQSQWNRIRISDDSGLQMATVHFAGEDTSYWYQVGDVWYYSRNGVVLTGWNLIDGATYYMDTTGAVQTGWQTLGGKTYWFSQRGVMATGWQTIDDNRYYFDKTGALQTGWVQQGSDWYYFDNSGIMVNRDCFLGGRLNRFAADGRWLGYGTVGFCAVDGKTYYLKNDNTYATGWLKVDGKWYFFHKSGSMATGWEKVGNYWYYLDPATGVMQTGWQVIHGNRYYLDSNGSMKTGWLKQNGQWYYLQASGAAAMGRVEVNGKGYIFGDDYCMLTGLIQATAVDGSGMKVFYADASGALQTGWVRYGNYWLYFYRDGHMAKDIYIDRYYINEDGIMEYKLNTDAAMDYHYGSTAAQAAQAEAVAKAIAKDALANGGQTDFEKVSYAVKKVGRCYNGTQNSNRELGVYESIYGPLCLGSSGNRSDQLAIGCVLDYMGYDWHQGPIPDERIYLKMDGEYGWIDIWGRKVSYGNRDDLNSYFPQNTTSANTAGNWVQKQGNWYFYDTQGRKMTGWVRDKLWYYLRADGTMATGWIHLNGTWYYCDRSGAMVTGLQTINGVKYCFDASGKMRTGWFISNRGDWYYANPSGALSRNCWQNIKGKDYYFYKDGHMAAEAFVGRYYVGSSGAYEYAVAANPDHRHYKSLTAQQAAEADAIAKAIAEEAMKNGGETDLEKILYASQIVKSYVKQCEYENDENRYYRSPYGVFVAKIYTCAGSTRAMGRVLEFMGYTWYHVGEDQWDHQWVCVKMDGEYGWVEPQAGEAGYGNYGESYCP